MSDDGRARLEDREGQKSGEPVDVRDLFADLLQVYPGHVGSEELIFSCFVFYRRDAAGRACLAWALMEPEHVSLMTIAVGLAILILFFIKRELNDVVTDCYLF